MNNKKIYFRYWILLLIFSVSFLSPVAASFTKLMGTPIGTNSYTGTALDDKSNVFDGNFNTFFESSNGWVGLDLGTAKVVTLVKYAPRAAFYAFRLNNAIIQGSNNADFSNSVDLLTIPSEPLENILTGASLNNTVAYRYVRIKATTDVCSISELEFFEGSFDANDKLTGTPIGTTPYQGAAQYDKFKAFDGDFNTFFDSVNGWIGLDLGTAKVVNMVKYAPRTAEFAFRLKNAIIQGANNSDFSDAVGLLTILSSPVEKILTVAFLNNTVAYRYVRLLSTADACSISELEFYKGNIDSSTGISNPGSRINTYQSGSSIILDLTGLSGQQTLTIYDLQGKNMLTRLVAGGEKSTVSNVLKKGVYLINVQGSEKAITTKLIIR